VSLRQGLRFLRAELPGILATREEGGAAMCSEIAAPGADLERGDYQKLRRGAGSGRWAAYPMARPIPASTAQASEAQEARMACFWASVRSGSLTISNG